MIDKIYKKDDDWKKILTPEQYRIMREKETETAFSCSWKKQGTGVYCCAACDLPLFHSKNKFESGTGWPSYLAPIKSENIEECQDNSLGMHRTEVLCARCESHLGHVFNDGPLPAKKRYCINSVALKFKPEQKNKNLEMAVLGGGCFWCLEAAFLRIKGVRNVTSGYAGGTINNPSYEQVLTGNTGHAEVIKIDYDPSSIKYKDLLYIFFAIHNPTTLNQQGNDVGHQYRSIILYKNIKQKAAAEEIIKELTEEEIYGNPIVTEIVPLKNFYAAEEYHQRYFDKNSETAYCQFMITPKIAKLREKFSKFYKYPAMDS